MRSRRNPLVELERALRVVEPGEHNLGRLIDGAADELAARLGVTAYELRGLAARPDGEAAPRLRELVQRLANERAARHGAAMGEASQAAARRLAMTAVWSDCRLAVDPVVLFGDLLADANRKFIAFHAPGAFQVSLPRSLLLDVGKALRPFAPDVVTWIDEEGFHVRWHRGRGGMNLFSQPIPAREAGMVLRVELPSPPVQVSTPLEQIPAEDARRPKLSPGPTQRRPGHRPLRPAPRPPVAARRRGDGWFAELLSLIAAA